MEPPVRSYNPNGPGGARQNGASAGKRSPVADAREISSAPQLATQTAPATSPRVPRAQRPPAGRRMSRVAVATDPDQAPEVTADQAVAPHAPKGSRRASPRATGRPGRRAAITHDAEAADDERQAADAAGGQTSATAQTDVAPPESLAAFGSLETVEASPGEGETGPVIGVADFEDIFTRFQTPLTNFVFRLVGNREQAYDLTQDVFVKAYRALSGGTTIQAAALSSWLYRIASNTATDALRRRRLISWLPLSLFNEDRGVGAGMPGMETPSAGQTPNEETLATSMSAFASGYDGSRFEQRVADREIVQRVLRRLPEKYAQCLLFYEYEGFSCAEIADMLSVSPSAVKMRLMRARERFITLYQEEVNG
ncbi:MAG TPA: sigma-70 family RNA polymerase sigma factor [Ktedonobacterales bacterium]|nr:sigma-70 family RNA polymerase sigma factor [Ktedonobacterales bacterium]